MSWTDDNGETDTVYLYPGDAENYLADEGVYGYADKAAEDYFSSLANRARAISDTGLNELIDVINEAHEVEKFARQELSDSHYTYDEAEDRYTLDRADDLYMRWQAVYLQFSEWLGKWQL